MAWIPGHDGCCAVSRLARARPCRVEILSAEFPIAWAANCFVKSAGAIAAILPRAAELWCKADRDPPCLNAGFLACVAAQVDIFKNTIHDNNTVVTAVYVHDNQIGAGGANPAGIAADVLAPKIGKPLPGIMWDGIVNPQASADLHRQQWRHEPRWLCCFPVAATICDRVLRGHFRGSFRRGVCLWERVRI